MADDDELDSISDELQVQQAKGEAVRQQIQAMQGSILELGAAMDALRNLQKAKGDTLLPLGAGVFLSCPKPDTDRVVVGIGAGLMVEKKPDDAIKLLEERQLKISDAIGLAQSDLNQVIKIVDDLTQRASMIGAAEERKNVRPSQEQAD